MNQQKILKFKNCTRDSLSNFILLAKLQWCAKYKTYKKQTTETVNIHIGITPKTQLLLRDVLLDGSWLLFEYCLKVSIITVM